MRLIRMTSSARCLPELWHLPGLKDLPQQIGVTTDAVAELGPAEGIRNAFYGFQQYLYAK